MGKMSFGKQGGRIRVRRVDHKGTASKPAVDVVRGIKENDRVQSGEDYREKSLAIHGLICARCGRTFTASNRHLLTVHHRDGNHNNNPPDGSNWENLCAYCHEDTHSRSVLADYFNGAGEQEYEVVYKQGSYRNEDTLSGTLGEKLRSVIAKIDKAK
jgi:cytochrome c553